MHTLAICGEIQRRPDSDYTGFDFWLTKLNQFNGNYIDAEMVKAFLSSIEYRKRFGHERPRSSRSCDFLMLTLRGFQSREAPQCNRHDRQVGVNVSIKGFEAGRVGA